MNTPAIVTAIQQAFPTLLAIYAFGSRIQQTHNNNSDLDLAILVEGYAPITTLFECSGTLQDIAHCPVDLLDLRAASTVMQYQIITTGECWFSKNIQAKLFEVFILSEKTDFDTQRAPLIQDILKRGHVYGR